VWRRAFLGPADSNNYVRVVYDALFRFSPTAPRSSPRSPPAPSRRPTSRCGRSSCARARSGPTAQPFGADDILFWYNDVLLNKELTPTLPGWIKNADGTAAKVEKVDDSTVRFTYAAPATLFLTAVANQDGADRTFAMFLPAHYLKKFHPSLRAQGRHREDGAGGGLQDLDRAVRQQKAPPENPERPTMAAWAPTSRASEPVFTLSAIRTIVGVDKDGNQLPYIDEVRFTYFADARRSTWRRSPATSTCRSATST
jgi:peptide/nickel transport system substrate-binding protein